MFDVASLWWHKAGFRCSRRRRRHKISAQLFFPTLLPPDPGSLSELPPLLPGLSPSPGGCDVTRELSCRTYGNVMRVYIEEERKWMLLGTININVSAGGAKNSCYLCRFGGCLSGWGVSLLFAAINAILIIYLN